MGASDSAVVDSSILAAVLLREPGFEGYAKRLGALTHARTAPFARFEVANALWKQRALTEVDAKRALELLFSLPLDDSFDLDDAQRAFLIARDAAHPFYDAAFIAIAEEEALPLWTLDQGQARIAKERGIEVVAWTGVT